MPLQGELIPWMRSVAEGTAIIGSILLAFAIDAAWERRGEFAEKLLESIRARLAVLGD